MPSEKAMTPHSSTLAWKVPWTEEPVRLQSMGLLSRPEEGQWPWETAGAEVSYSDWLLLKQLGVACFQG